MHKKIMLDIDFLCKIEKYKKGVDIFPKVCYNIITGMRERGSKRRRNEFFL